MSKAGAFPSNSVERSLFVRVAPVNDPPFIHVPGAHVNYVHDEQSVPGGANTIDHYEVVEVDTLVVDEDTPLRVDGVWVDDVDVDDIPMRSLNLEDGEGKKAKKKKAKEVEDEAPVSFELFRFVSSLAGEHGCQRLHTLLRSLGILPGDKPELTAALAADHYDPAYDKSMRAMAPQVVTRVEAESLSDRALDGVAARIEAAVQAISMTPGSPVS